MRFTPHFRKLIPLLAQWRLLEGHEQEMCQRSGHFLEASLKFDGLHRVSHCFTMPKKLYIYICFTISSWYVMIVISISRHDCQWHFRMIFEELWACINCYVSWLAFGIMFHDDQCTDLPNDLRLWLDVGPSSPPESTEFSSWAPWDTIFFYQPSNLLMFHGISIYLN
jgi:hypothetical protein